MKRAALWLALCGTAFAVPPDARSVAMSLLPDATWEGTPPPSFPSTAKQHVDALKADEQHGQAFWVTGVHGNPDAARVVFLVPQFHRSPLLPLLWNSLGEAIAGVQQNIDYVVTRLAVAHGLTCVGTEGSWAPIIPRSEEQAALAGAFREMSLAVPPVRALKPELGDAAQRAVDLLAPYMRRQALTLDGVGSALWRLSPSKVRRFGLEDERLNQRSLDLLASMRKLEEQIARLVPEEQAEVEDAMAGLWRDEFPAFERDVATPLADALGTLDRARKEALHDDVQADAEVLARFTKLARTLSDEVLRIDDVRSYADYYRDVGRAPSTEKKPRKPTAAQRRKAAALARKLAPLQAEYEALAGTRREEAAAARVVERLGDHGACAMVFGANHEEGLLKALASRAGASVAVVVVQPFPPDG